MLTITQSQLPLNSGQLDIHCDYYYRNRISKIPSAKFNYQEKKWTIEKFALGALANTGVTKVTIVQQEVC